MLFRSGVAGYATPKGIGAFQEWRKGPVSTQFARQVDDITRALPSSAHAMMADTPTAAAQTTEAALPDVIAQINADPELSAQWGAWKPGAFRNQPIEILRAATNKAIKAIEEYRRRQLGDAADMKVPTIDNESIDLALMGGQRQIVATPEARNKAIDRVLARYDLTDASNVPAQRAFDIATKINKNQRARRATMSNVDAATLEEIGRAHV